MAITVSKMTGGSNSHETTSEEANGIATDFVSEGIIGSYNNTGGVAPATGAFAVNAQGTPDMTVAVSSGVAYVTGTPTSQNSQTFRVYNSASENVTISANSSGSTKYDWVYIKLDATLLANPTLAGTTTATLVTSRSTSAGTDDGTPPTYGYPVAVVTVANGAVSITNSTIRDIRGASSIGVAAGQATGWNVGALPAVSSVTNNGNRSYDIVFGSTVASLLSPGMRLRTTRTVSAPAGSFYFDGVNDYFSKATPNKLTFTDNFTCSGWINLLAYQQGGIISRFNGTSGFTFRVEATGQLSLLGFNAAAGNYRWGQTYQSIPLNKWTHVAASWATGTLVLYIDGLVAPSATTTAGTAPTAIVQAGDLQYGATNGAGFLSGRGAQFAVFDAVLSAATIRSYSSQTLSGSETNLKTAHSGAGLLDLNTTTPNDMTASGALSGQGYSPYCDNYASLTTDYELVMKVNGATATVQVPEGCTIPTSGGVSAVAYSTATSPFGFTLDKGRWEVESYFGAASTSPTLTAGYKDISWKLTIPLGAWDIGFQTVFNLASTAAQTDVYAGVAMSTSTSSATDPRLTAATLRLSGASSTIRYNTNVARSQRTTLASATTYNLTVDPEAGAQIAALTLSSKSNMYAIPAGI